MTRDEIIRMAREAWGSDHEIFWFDDCGIERFAALVAAAEREACAKVCEGRIGGAIQSNDWWAGFKTAMKQSAEIIRARGDA